MKHIVYLPPQCGIQLSFPVYNHSHARNQIRLYANADKISWRKSICQSRKERGRNRTSEFKLNNPSPFPARCLFLKSKNNLPKTRIVAVLRNGLHEPFKTLAALPGRGGVPNAEKGLRIQFGCVFHDRFSLRIVSSA